MITRNHIRPALTYVSSKRKEVTEMTIIAIICLGLLTGVAVTEAKAV
jgi:hypothetical protein